MFDEHGEEILFVIKNCSSRTFLCDAFVWPTLKLWLVSRAETTDQLNVIIAVRDIG